MTDRLDCWEIFLALLCGIGLGPWILLSLVLLAKLLGSLC